MIEENEQLLAQVKKHEGLRLTTYYCPAGALTIGYGHNLEARPIAGITKGSTIAKERAEEILKADLAEFAADLDKRLPWWRGIDEVRQGVLLNMAFNLGIAGLLGFRNTLKYIESGNYAQAASNMLASKWAKQVGVRATQLARQMESGKWA